MFVCLSGSCKCNHEHASNDFLLLTFRSQLCVHCNCNCSEAYAWSLCHVFADCVHFDSETARVFAGIILLLIRVIYAQSENCCIESARRHAVSHAQGKRCHMLGPCTEVKHLARFHDDLNRSSSQHSYSCYMQEDHLVCPGMCGSVAAFST